MTARLSLLFALVLGWACAAQANLPDRAFNTQTQTTGTSASPPSWPAVPTATVKARRPKRRRIAPGAVGAARLPASARRKVSNSATVAEPAPPSSRAACLFRVLY